LTIFADLIGMLGGATVGILILGLSPNEYWKASLEALNLRHFFVGLFHGFIFGCVISICSCYHGIKSGRDADSVGKATINAVVYSIVWMIICTSIITIFCQIWGI
jgi:phospholipid/cholesterol/gamma-HCH transport system permease protein